MWLTVWKNAVTAFLLVLKGARLRMALCVASSP